MFEFLTNLVYIFIVTFSISFIIYEFLKIAKNDESYRNELESMKNQVRSVNTHIDGMEKMLMKDVDILLQRSKDHNERLCQLEHKNTNQQ